VEVLIEGKEANGGETTCYRKQSNPWETRCTDARTNMGLKRNDRRPLERSKIKEKSRLGVGGKMSERKGEIPVSGAHVKINTRVAIG